MRTNGAVKFVSPTFLRRVCTLPLRHCGIRRMRVRQNRVVPAVVATVKLSWRCGASNRINHIVNSRGEGGMKEFGSRESTA